MRWLQARLALLLPMGTALILLPTWWRFGRDPALGSVPVAYEPPEGLPPAVLGALVQENVGGATLRASLVDLSVKGHLCIEQLQEMLLFLPLKRHYRFTLLTSGPQWQALAPHEVYLLEHLFPSLEAGRSVDTEELRDHFYVHIPGFEELVRERVLDEGFYRRWPGTVRGITFAAGLAAAAAVVAAALGMLPKDIAQLQGAADPLITVLALLATLALIGAFAWSMPSRTPGGWRCCAGHWGSRRSCAGSTPPATGG